MKDLSRIDALIQKGQGAEAKNLLLQYAKGKNKRESLVQLASYARRLSLFELSLKFLGKIIHPPDRKVSDASDVEKAEYGAALASAGAVEEALKILGSIDTKQLPTALLYRVFAHFSDWNYKDTIPLIYEYIEASQLSEYQKLVGRANLASALVYEKDPRAKLELNRLLSEAKKGSHVIVEGYGLKLEAEMAIYARKWEDAVAKLQQAEKAFANTQSIELFFIRKWLAITSLFLTADPKKAVAALDSISKEALERRHYETIRSLDLYKAIRFEDVQLAHKLYFGTPYQHYKERLLQECPFVKSVPESFLYSFGKKNAEEVNLFSRAQNSPLKPGKLKHRLVSALASDLYRPIKVATLHARIYPGEYFNPYSSSHRVAQAVHRQRQWLEHKKLPLKITEENGSYSLEATSPCCMRIYRTTAPKNLSSHYKDSLSRLYPTAFFTVNDVVRDMKLELWTAKRILKTLHRDGFLSREGKASKTQYFISAESLKKAA